MSTEGLLALVVMLVGGIIWLVWPLLRRKTSSSVEMVQQQKEREMLLTTYERTLAAIRDLDEDHLTSKLSQADYETERAAWAEQGVLLLQEIEKFGGKVPAKRPKAAPHTTKQPAAVPTEADAELDDAIEQAIANYVKSSHG
ncbi:MAG: hypothetical protein R3E39_21985 [Anaerolineae bacterium]